MQIEKNVSLPKARNQRKRSGQARNRKKGGEHVLRSLAVVTLALIVGCSQPISTREKSTGAGALLGGATGALIGAAVGNPAAGAAIGAGLGGVSGALVGDKLQQRDTEITQQEGQIQQQQQEIAQNRQLLEELKRQGLDAEETSRGVVVNLPDVLFQFGQAGLTGEARSRVADISDILNNQARDRRVSIEGHTDSVGGEAANQRLSERRAGSVASELEGNGVARSRITTKGYGERYPVAPNASPDGGDNPQGRSKNRRVEVVIEN
jgi:outer membrane protein OmpA-like peptidoglycan-associated protein